MDKKSYIENLIEKNYFWSYSVKSADDLTESLIIEHVLLMGSVEEILELFRHYDRKLIRQVWQTKLIPDQRYYKLNSYLAKVFFHVVRVDTYFSKYKKNSRYERLKKLAATD